MGWSGDISQIGQLADRMADLANVPSRVAARVSQKLAENIQDEFAAGTDPYGEPWQPLAPATVARGRGAPPLTDTGDMLDSLRVAPLPGAGVSITIAHPAAPHQTGWSGDKSIGPARPILPAGESFPELWEEILTKAAEDEFRKAVK